MVRGLLIIRAIALMMMKCCLKNDTELQSRSITQSIESQLPPKILCKSFVNYLHVEDRQRETPNVWKSYEENIEQ